MHHTIKSILVLVLANSIVSMGLHAQSPTPDSQYSPQTAAHRIETLKTSHFTFEEMQEFKQLLKSAVEHQDVRAVVLAVDLPHPDAQSLAIHGIFALPVRLEKDGLAMVMRNDQFWNDDPKTGPSLMHDNQGLNRAVRNEVSRLLNKDLRTLSKFYNSDKKLQDKNESMHIDPLLDAVSRERIAKELAGA